MKSPSRSEFFQRLLARLIFAHKLLVPRDHLGHPLFDRCQILRRKRLLAIEVVEESRIRRRPMAQLGLRKQLQHRRRHHVRGRVTHHLQRLGIVLLHAVPASCPRSAAPPDPPAAVADASSAAYIAASDSPSCRQSSPSCSRSHRGQPRHNRGRGQPRRNRVGDFKGRRARRALRVCFRRADVRRYFACS